MMHPHKHPHCNPPGYKGQQFHKVNDGKKREGERRDNEREQGKQGSSKKSREDGN